MPRTFGEARKDVLARLKAEDGCMMSEFKGLDKAAVKWLINQGKADSRFLPKRGDWIVNLNG